MQTIDVSEDAIKVHIQLQWWLGLRSLQSKVTDLYFCEKGMKTDAKVTLLEKVWVLQQSSVPNTKLAEEGIYSTVL